MEHNWNNVIDSLWNKTQIQTTSTKTFLELLFSRNLHLQVIVLCTLLASCIHVFPSKQCLFKLSKMIICTPKFCNKNKVHHACLLENAIYLSCEPSHNYRKSRHFVHVRTLITHKFPAQ